MRYTAAEGKGLRRGDSKSLDVNLLNSVVWRRACSEIGARPSKRRSCMGKKR